MDRRRWVGRIPAAVTSAVCVATVVAGLLLATGAATPAVALASSGHWVVNAAERTVVHVDGGTAQVDAKVELREDIGEPLLAVQGEQQGFVVGRERIAVFGRSTLTVDASIPVGFDEVPVGIETVGGPYLVYPTAGTIVRLGLPPLTLPVGGPVARPVWTDDGTVWLQRTDDGSFCAVRAGIDVLDCSAGVAAGEPGGLTITGAVPAFVGTRRDAAQVVAASLGAPVGLGADVAEAGLLADRDTEGRLAVVEPGVNRLVLADSAGVPDGWSGGPAVTADLGRGDFTSPIASGGVVAVLDLATNRLLTFDVAGAPLGTAQLPPGAAPTLTRGADGRIYVDDAGGASTHVVGPDGGVVTVATGGRLPDTVAIAAPPERISPVVPPAPSVPGPNLLPTIGLPPRLPGPPTGPPGSLPPPAIVPPPAGTPPAPTGVTARVDGAAVIVSWRPVIGATRYEVSSSTGAQQSTVGPTSTVVGLPVNEPTTFTVRATVAGVTGPPSEPTDAVHVRGGPADPPTGFAARVTPASGASPFVLTWQRPDLRGGRLVGYEVTATDRLGDRVALTATGERVEGNLFNCEAPYTVEIRAITEVPNVAGTVRGEPGRTEVANGVDCSMTGRISAAPDGPGRVTVTADVTGGGDAFVDGDCRLEFDGAVRWTGTCSPRDSGRPITVDGLDAGVTYDVRMTISVPGHGTTTGNTVAVTTEAITYRTGDINRDGSVGCIDQGILESQWQQTGLGLSADLNDDEIVNIYDESILLSNWTGDGTGSGGGTC